jgi:peptidoglycan-associated lipoprotein
MNNPIRIAIAIALTVGVAACAKKQEVKPAEVADTTPTTTTAPADDGKYGPEDLETDSCLRQRVVYFDFDRADIKSEAAAILACHGKYLSDRPSAAITLEGHADERGSREYNLGLGERRANAAKNFLVSQGIEARRVATISYGKERPSVNGSNEAAWSQNRRGVAVVN